MNKKPLNPYGWVFYLGFDGKTEHCFNYLREYDSFSDFVYHYDDELYAKYKIFNEEYRPEVETGHYYLAYIKDKDKLLVARLWNFYTHLCVERKDRTPEVCEFWKPKMLESLIIMNRFLDNWDYK